MGVKAGLAGARRAALSASVGIACAALLLAAGESRGAVVQRITAVVNDEVISAYDLQQRMRLVISSSGINPTPEVIGRIEQQVLRALVDERLQLQEAEKESITVESLEVERALMGLAQQNSMTIDDIRNMLAQGGVDYSTLRDQIRAEIAWSKLVNRRFGGRVIITEEQVEAELSRALESFAKPQYLLSEIVLRVDQPEQDEDVRRTAQRLYEQLQQGASFPALARQFSQSSTSGLGGDLGWMERDQIDPALQAALDRIAPGQISAPVRTIRGYHILALRQRRDQTGEVGAAPSRDVTLKALVQPLPQDADDNTIDAALDRVHEAAKKLRGCSNIDAVASSEPGLVAADLGRLSIDQVQQPLRDMVERMDAGDVSIPFRAATGAQVIVVCNRAVEMVRTPVTPPSREEVEARLYNQQISMMARRYLRDLRRDAVVEYR